MPLVFGGKNSGAQPAALAAAHLSAGLAGRPRPADDLTVEGCIAFIANSLAALAEARENDRREIARFLAAQTLSRAADASAGTRSASAQVPEPGLPPAGILALADLRDRLRVLAGQRPEGPPDTGPQAQADRDGGEVLPWVVERLDDGLRLLGTREFDEAGPVDPRRHQVVDRCAATAEGAPGTVARSVRTGLTLHGTVVRPQQIVVYVDEGREISG